MPKAIRILPVILFLTWTTAGFAQAPCEDNASTPVSTSPLPSPTGPFKVGRTAYYVKGAPGEGVMVHVWYPADTPTSARPAPYVAGWPEASQKILEPVRRLFREASCDFEQGRIYSYALEQAPVANRERRYPLIVFAPGLGISSFVYAALIEELASDGYIVAGVE